MGEFHGMQDLSAKHSCLMGRLNTKGVLGETFKGPIVPFGSLVECYLTTAKDQSRIHQFGKKSDLDCSSDMHCTWGEFGR